MSEHGTGEEPAREALAERLRELREGSGRTYASLGRRIGVSASTLHRYCTGRTVPAEFAPVERLARLCGRTGEERQALHLLWLRADAERVERQEAGILGVAAGQEDPAPTAAEPLDPADPEALGDPPSPAPSPVHRDEHRPDPAPPGPRSPSVRRWVPPLTACAAVAVLALVLIVAFGNPSRPDRPAPPAPGARPPPPPVTRTPHE
ncbi:helix-turn-helix domain-containing protein, partial [Streptomyces sp. NPDC059586]|uniref:helix-turn-helix domain-containing protein n=1 Tax=Streptomyces sp. NPDC059586 TaxID=3346876 RepID=UPI0036A6C600